MSVPTGLFAVRALLGDGVGCGFGPPWPSGSRDLVHHGPGVNSGLRAMVVHGPHVVGWGRRTLSRCDARGVRMDLGLARRLRSTMYFLERPAHPFQSVVKQLSDGAKRHRLRRPPLPVVCEFDLIWALSGSRNLARRIGATVRAGPTSTRIPGEHYRWANGPRSRSSSGYTIALCSVSSSIPRAMTAGRLR
jgi:hypothetical protein